MPTHDTLETDTGWLSEEQLGSVRGQVPMVYVEAVPVRVDHLGRVEKVGTLLRAQADGTISRAVVSGRILYNESVRASTPWPWGSWCRATASVNRRKTPSTWPGCIPRRPWHPTSLGRCRMVTGASFVGPSPTVGSSPERYPTLNFRVMVSRERRPFVPDGG